MRLLPLLFLVHCANEPVEQTGYSPYPRPEAVAPVAATGPTGSTGATGETSTLGLIVEPSDAGKGLIDAINNASTSVHMTMYLLTDYGVENALVARAQAGVEVSVLLNQNNQPGDSGSPANSKSFAWLQSHGVTVAWAPTGFTFTHEKCVIIDASTAWVMTMNASKSALTDNREYLAIDTDPKDVAEAEALFAADVAGTAFTPGESRLLISPINARQRLAALIASARTSIDLEVEELSDYAFVQQLCAAQTANVAVRVMISAGTLTSAQSRAARTLQSCGVTMKTLAAPNIHAKTMVVDASSAYVGSVNFTQVSLDQNRELGLISTDADMVKTIAETIDGDIAAGVSVN